MGAAGVLTVITYGQLPGIGAGALLHPHRRPVTVGPPPGCEKVTFAGGAGALHGWRCAAVGQRRGTLIYLHGVADNRMSGAGILTRFAAQGFQAVAYDSRAHGQSDGDFCTYGYFEKDDLRRVLDATATSPVVLVGTSLGAAVALQHASADPRVRVVVAAEAFSDLRTVAVDRAPSIFTAGLIDASFKRAQQLSGMEVEAVSPRRAAREITVPTLVIHGGEDVETPPAHAQRIFDALAGPKRLILVPGAGHNQSLRESVWTEIDAWIGSGLIAESRDPVAASNRGPQAGDRRRTAANCLHRACELSWVVRAPYARSSDLCRSARCGRECSCIRRSIRPDSNFRWHDDCLPNISHMPAPAVSVGWTARGDWELVDHCAADR